MRFFRLLAGILLVTVAVGFAGSIFQAGYVAGAAGGAPGAGGAWYGWSTFGWGFGGFHILGTLFTLFVIFALLRFAFGGHGRGHAWKHSGHGQGRMGWGPGGSDDRGQFGGWERHARDLHSEWHQANEGTGPAKAATTDPDTLSTPPPADDGN